LGTTSVIAYGIGTIIGAGIFVLLGKIIGIAGAAAPAAFVVAALVAAITAISYGELAARLPVSAGEAAYVDAAFNRGHLTLLVGLTVAGCGILSAATIAHGFAGYLRVLVDWPALPIALLYLAALGAVAALGIREAAWLVALIAITSTIALVLVGVAVVVGADHWRLPETIWQPGAWSFTGLFAGAFLAFYAFIGFEDLVNLAEEIKRPGPTLKLAIPVALAVSGAVYIGLCLAAMGAAPIAELAATEAPIVFLLDKSGIPGQPVVAVLGMVAISNGALAQLIMAARVIYGLSRRQLLPAALGKVHQRTRIPLIATLLVISLTLALIANGTVLGLARMASALILAVFTIVNLALFVMLRREHAKTWQKLLPLFGAVSCLGLLTSELLHSL
jgi:basic amino acid/polyamine antiporter, APA family